MNILVSACLLGIPCRYDGTGAECRELSALVGRHSLVPVCPEQLGGLPTPRQPAEICRGQVVTRDGADVTRAFQKGAELALSIAKRLDCTHAILKRNSPSCGHGHIYDGSFSGVKTPGDGLTAKMLMDNGIAVSGEDSLGTFL